VSLKFVFSNDIVVLLITSRCEPLVLREYDDALTVTETADITCDYIMAPPANGNQVIGVLLPRSGIGLVVHLQVLNTGDTTQL